MGSIWCVKPDVKKIDLAYSADGQEYKFWIKVKKHLTIGETRRMQTAGFGGVKADARASDQANTELSIDWQMMSFARASVYIVDWSLEDDSQTKLVLNRETIESLEPDVFKLIDDAIGKHVTEMEDQKKAQAGGSGLTAISA